MRLSFLIQFFAPLRCVSVYSSFSSVNSRVFVRHRRIIRPLHRILWVLTVIFFFLHNYVLLLFSLGTIVSPKRKWKQCLEGQTKSNMVFLKVAYSFSFSFY